MARSLFCWAGEEQFHIKSWSRRQQQCQRQPCLCVTAYSGVTRRPAMSARPLCHKASRLLHPCYTSSTSVCLLPSSALNSQKPAPCLICLSPLRLKNPPFLVIPSLSCLRPSVSAATSAVLNPVAMSYAEGTTPANLLLTSHWPRQASISIGRSCGTVKTG